MVGSATFSKGKTAQAAMEYLMTYGWAILIIAIVAVSLFALGVFSGGGSSATCTASSGFICSTPLLSASGTITVTIGQSLSPNVYNVQVACSAGTGIPSPITEFEFVPSNTVNAVYTTYNSATPGNQLTLASGGSISISGLPCYSATGTSLGSQAIGTSFSGHMWVNYTVNSGTPSSSTNPWYSFAMGTLNLKVS